MSVVAPVRHATAARRADGAGDVVRNARLARQTGVGLTLGTVILIAWLTIHVYGNFFHVMDARGALLAVPLVILQSWLTVGLFITAHDAMHGSLAPLLPRLGALLGRCCVGLYAAFSYDELLRNHHSHHSNAGTADDPDFDADHPTGFLPWYLRFFREYFSLREFAILTAVLVIYLWPLGASPLNLVVFWALPAIASSLMLFGFGTYLPHRHGPEPFADRHNARSNGYGRLASLLTCYHFGAYHHEHHSLPGVPWWGLPEARRRLAEGTKR